MVELVLVVWSVKSFELSRLDLWRDKTIGCCLIMGPEGPGGVMASSSFTLFLVLWVIVHASNSMGGN
jgi:hypothetical protein